MEKIMSGYQHASYIPTTKTINYDHILYYLVTLICIEILAVKKSDPVLFIFKYYIP